MGYYFNQEKCKSQRLRQSDRDGDQDGDGERRKEGLNGKSVIIMFMTKF